MFPEFLKFSSGLNSTSRSVRRSTEPFGGIQLIVCGDFLQLPPVSKGKEKASFCFQVRNCVVSLGCSYVLCWGNLNAQSAFCLHIFFFFLIITPFRLVVGVKSSSWTWSWQKCEGKQTSRSSPSCRRWGWEGKTKIGLILYVKLRVVLVKVSATGWCLFCFFIFCLFVSALLGRTAEFSVYWTFENCAFDRVARVTEDVTAKLLQSAYHQIERDGILATRLCTHKDDVELTNENKLQQLPG